LAREDIDQVRQLGHQLFVRLQAFRKNLGRMHA